MRPGILSIHHPAGIRPDSRCAASKSYRGTTPQINLLLYLCPWHLCSCSPYATCSSKRASACIMALVCEICHATSSALLYHLGLSVQPNAYRAEPSDLCYQCPPPIVAGKKRHVPQMQRSVCCLRVELSSFSGKTHRQTSAERKDDWIKYTGLYKFHMLHADELSL